jgi:hypothetical protein
MTKLGGSADDARQAPQPCTQCSTASSTTCGFTNGSSQADDDGEEFDSVLDAIENDG